MHQLKALFPPQQVPSLNKKRNFPNEANPVSRGRLLLRVGKVPIPGEGFWHSSGDRGG